MDGLFINNLQHFTRISAYFGVIVNDVIGVSIGAEKGSRGASEQFEPVDHGVEVASQVGGDGEIVRL